QVHTVGALPDDVVLITNEAVLVAILERRLSPELALEQGLLRVEGETSRSEAVRRAVLRSAATADRAFTAVPPKAAPFFNAKKP
ncbi:MAG: hypothetical protein ACK4N6_03750, partial [Rhodocyclaceae bacterium]